MVRVLGSIKAAASLFLVEAGGVLSVVDAGVEGCGGRVLRALRRTGRRPEDVRQIVLSHCHGDHSGEGRRLRELTGATIVAGAQDVPVIDGSSSNYPAPRSVLGRAIYRNLERFSRFPVDRPVEGPEALEGGLLAVPAPGHTAGHIAVWAPQLSALFVGDAVWCLGRLVPSPRQFTVDWERNVESIKELAALGAARVYPGHGPSFSGDRLRALARRL